MSFRVGSSAKSTLKIMDEMNAKVARAVHPPRCQQEAKEQVVIEGSTLLIRKFADSAVGRALKALKGKMS